MLVVLEVAAEKVLPEAVVHEVPQLYPHMDELGKDGAFGLDVRLLWCDGEYVRVLGGGACHVPEAEADEDEDEAG